MTPEGRIKRMMTARIKILQSKYPGKVVYRMPVLRGMGRPLLDYLLCVSGRMVLIETKKDADTPMNAIQNATWNEFKQAGAVCFLVYDEETATTAMMVIDYLVHYPWTPQKL